MTRQMSASRVRKLCNGLIVVMVCLVQQDSRFRIQLSTCLDISGKKRGVNPMREERDELMILEEGHSTEAELACCATGATKVR